jgi:hypothetical protein
LIGVNGHWRHCDGSFVGIFDGVPESLHTSSAAVVASANAGNVLPNSLSSAAHRQPDNIQPFNERTKDRSE